MHFYKCYIAVDSWGMVDFENVDYIWAHSAEEAVMEYRKAHGYRKNKKGLTVQEVEYRRVKRSTKTKTEAVTHSSPLLGGYDYQTWEDVTHYYCSNCGKEVRKDNRYCEYCDSELI